MFYAKQRRKQDKMNNATPRHHTRANVHGCGGEVMMCG